MCPFWFCNHIFKVDLDHVVVEMLGVAVDQVDLLGVRVVHLLLVHLVGHGLVVGLVDVALFPDGNSVEMSLGRVTTAVGRIIQKGKQAVRRRQPSDQGHLELEIQLTSPTAAAQRTKNSCAPPAF